VLRKRVVVDGLVQGVFFRDSCRREAQVRGVSGWVRNNPDGTVEAAFEGEEQDVQDMVVWMRCGPRGAHVESVDVSTEDPQGAKGFRVG
jgi:acylphosphatase